MPDGITAGQLRDFLNKTPQLSPQKVYAKGPDGVNREITAIEVSWIVGGTEQPPAFLVLRTT